VLPSPFVKDRSAADWEELARREPHFAVLTEQQFLQENLAPEALGDFWATGECDVEFLFDLIRKHLSRELVPDDVLDFGCGVGRLTLALARRARRVVGVDVSPTMIDLAKRYAADQSVENVEFAHHLNGLPAESFDLICSLIVFQHIPVPQGKELFRRLLQLLRPGGVVAVQFTFTRPGNRLRQLARTVRARLPFVHRLAQVVKGEPLRLPYMQMNTYHLTEVIAALRDAGCGDPWIESTDHGGIEGAIIVAGRRLRP
jgi:2-polyprenyl-3-methyl-5-hydroxy-6-metoxy-1,4-benzoquinol methylase